MTATFVVSIEVELGWGTHDLNDFSHLSADGSVEREFLDLFLQIADRHSVAVTFNVVGKLFDKCDTNNDRHLYPSGWFSSETGQKGLFYGPDLINAIDNTDVNHEVCTHTYSHILFEDMSRNVAQADLREAQRTHYERYRSKTKSLVPPRHQEPEMETLKENNIEIIRLGRPLQSSTRPGLFWELFVGLPFAHTPRTVDDVVETYVSRFPSLTVPLLPRGRSSPPSVFKLIPTEFRGRTYRYGIKRALDQASKNNQVVHLWCHVYNFSSKQQIKHIDKLFSMVSSRDDVQTKTMAQLNEAVRGQ
ncbi:polysaccharide deacetylase family protein [Natrononativus amylolyticus]|uniref:polysaccharide deacetylase family protein n=1 Tax=Natrononativus amylolyticus TaxID=2963434 RepID=UPI0020CD5CE6|nr:polysaccharide deacetylase family protein [Natrononativus amylolyticus]